MSCVCNGTGLVYERREGTKHALTCKECGRHDPHELGADLYRLARETPGVPVVRSV
jgi:hypothetical protein